MKYVDIGYIVCLGALFSYAVSLVLRRRRLTRAAAVAEVEPGVGDPAPRATADRRP